MGLLGLDDRARPGRRPRPVNALAGIPLGLLHPSGNRLCGRLELTRQLFARASDMALVARKPDNVVHHSDSQWIRASSRAAELSTAMDRLAGWCHKATCVA